MIVMMLRILHNLDGSVHLMQPALHYSHFAYLKMQVSRNTRVRGAHFFGVSRF